MLLSDCLRECIVRVGDAWEGEAFITSALLGLGNASKGHFP